MAGEEIEYESDPEDAKYLKTRREEASDDEEDGEEGVNRPEEPPRRVHDSDEEREGAAAEYEDKLDEGDEEYNLSEEYLEVGNEESGGLEAVAVAVEKAGGGGETGGAVENELMKKKVVSNDTRENDDETNDIVDDQHEEEGKDIDPFAVPKAGAFYMHDDRFGDNARGRNRRMLGGRKLWELKDNGKWGHDKFEELSSQERHHGEHRRGSRRHYRGRGRNRGAGRGYAQGNRSKGFATDTQHNDNQNNAPMRVRGRGPQRYLPSFSNKKPIPQNKQSGKSVEKHSYASSGRVDQSVYSAEPDAVPSRKQVASNLNIASPPFYPTGSSTKDGDQNGQHSIVGESLNNMPRSAGAIRGKTTDSNGVDNNYTDDSPPAMAGKPSTLSSSYTNPTKPQLRGQGRRPNSSAQMAYQPVVSSNNVNRFPSASELQSIRRNTGQNHAHLSRSQSSSPPKASSAAAASIAFELGEKDSVSISSQTKTAQVDKGKGGVQGSGKGTFLYGGAQVMGASGGPGDQNFPAFLPVMQFGGQRPGGIGVPAVGMAFPGYVAQPQLGLGSSEMTWLPVLAGAAGALGATYCPPYITADGSYNSRSSSTSSKETNSANGNDRKSIEKSVIFPSAEVASDDFGQRQKNPPRRYTEMKFDQ